MQDDGSINVYDPDDKPEDSKQKLTLNQLVKGLLPGGTIKIGSIDGYRIVRYISAGAFGVVFLVTTKTDGRIRVVKYVPITDRLTEKEIRKAADHAAEIEGSHVLLPKRVFSSRDIQQAVGIEMDWADKPLTEFLEQEPFDPFKRLEIAWQAAEGLQAVHQAGYVHRDLKPGNILVLNHRPVLVDFDFLTMPGEDEALVGTPEYMAPEIITHRQYTAASDMYAFGLILGLLVTDTTVKDLSKNAEIEDRLGMGRVLRGELDQLLEKIADEAGEPWVAVHRLYRKLTADDPNARPSAGDVVAFLSELLKAAREAETTLQVPGKATDNGENPTKDEDKGDTLTEPPDEDVEKRLFWHNLHNLMHAPWYVQLVGWPALIVFSLLILADWAYFMLMFVRRSDNLMESWPYLIGMVVVLLVSFLLAMHRNREGWWDNIGGWLGSVVLLMGFVYAALMDWGIFGPQPRQLPNLFIQTLSLPMDEIPACVVRTGNWACMQKKPEKLPKTVELEKTHPEVVVSFPSPNKENMVLIQESPDSLLYMSDAETTVGSFQRFVKETAFQTHAQRPEINRSVVYDLSAFRPRIMEHANWRSPGYVVADDLPVTCVTLSDAVAYCEWLNSKEKETGRLYRLPTAAEWRSAWKNVNGFPWGNNMLPAYANLLDVTDAKAGIVGSRDGYPYPSPVRVPKEDRIGNIYGLVANVSEWTSSPRGRENEKLTPPVWNPNWDNRMKDGLSWIIMGSSWASRPADVAGQCSLNGAQTRYCFVPANWIGFRVVCEVKRQNISGRE